MKTSSSKTISLWILPGLLSGIAFLTIALISGALGTNFWGMPDAIARVFGMAVPADYSFSLVPIVVGIITHLVLSVALGVLFTAFVLWCRLHGWLLYLAAIVFVSIETATALWVVMHNILPASTFNFYLGAIPWWGSVIGHYVYALLLALLLSLNPAIIAQKQQTAPNS